MNAQILTFSANEQTLIKTGGIDDFASNTVRYAKATFTLGTNWTGFDSVRAVWKTACYTISTVLDANHSCDVPPEVLSYKAKVYVNLVGSISENGVLTDRLTTFPVLAMHIKSNAPVEGTETAPITASQFEQFVETVQDAADSISDYSYDSEAWAVGKRGGVDVPSTDETYHNNSKYWAEQNAGLSDDVADLKSDLQNRTDSRNLLGTATFYPDKYYSTSPSDSDKYCFFSIPVTSGTTYYISPAVRFVSKDGVKILDETLEPVTYTADFTGNLYVTFFKSYPGWVVTTEPNYKNIVPFDAPSLCYYGNEQTTGQNENKPMSQKAITNQLNIQKSYSDGITFRMQIRASENGFDGMTLVEGKYYDISGAHELSSYNYYIVYVVKGETYHFTPRARMVVVKVNDTVVQSNLNDNIREFTSQYNGIAYITVYASETVTMIAGRTDESLETQFVPADAMATGIVRDGLYSIINRNLLLSYDLNEGYMDLSGHPYVYERYQYTDKIPVSEDDVYYTGKARFVTFFIGDMAYSNVGLNYEDETVLTHTFTVPENIDGMVISYYKNDSNKYLRTTPDYFTGNAQTEIIDVANNSLKGKWWACGDSFTEWTTESYNISELPNMDGLAHYKTYPYWIAKRNPSLSVYNFAVSGQTMAMPANPGSFTNAFSNNKYTQIPSDVDFITIKLGINDNNHRQGGGDGEDPTGYIPIGDVTDTGTATFCGAYNTVLAYLIEHHPFAKIGILVTNGCEGIDDYRTKTIAIAERWGLPWLDENGEARCPAMIRSSNPNVLQTVKDLRRTQQAADLSQGNTHPNVAAHEFESTFIEAFLRSL